MAGSHRGTLAATGHARKGFFENAVSVGHLALLVAWTTPGFARAFAAAFVLRAWAIEQPDPQLQQPI